MSLFKRKRSLTAAEFSNQQILLRHSAEKGVASLNLLCGKLHSLLHDEPEDTEEAHHSPHSDSHDIYHQFLTPDALSTTHHTDNLSAPKRSHARFNQFLNESRAEMGVHVKNGKSPAVNPLQFRRDHQRAHGSEDCFIDGRYLVWFCGFMFERAAAVNTEGMEKEALNLLDQWQGSIIDLFTGDKVTEDKVMWRLLLQNLDIGPKMLNDATVRHLNNASRDNMGIEQYFQWPSFLRNLVVNRQLSLQDENQRGNKRRKSNDGTFVSLQSHYQPISLLEMMDPKIQRRRNAWLPLLGYTVTHAYLSRGRGGCTIHETMDYLQNVLVPSLPSTMGLLDSDKKKALLCGMAACLIDALGVALAVGILSLKDEEDEVQKIDTGESGIGGILGAEVAQIVDLLCVQSVIPTLAKNISCSLAGLVSEIAGTLLDYSDVHHKLHHEASPTADDNDVIQQLMAKDALGVMYFIEKTNPQLRREVLAKKFTTQGDPRKHPIVTYLRACLVSGNLDEGSKLCRTLESCTGLDKETEKCCWYSLFDKMQEDYVLLEHHWEINRGRFVDVPVLDSRGKIAMRRIGNVTLANIMIGPFGRTVALEYLRGIIDVAKEELFPGFKYVSSSNSIKSRHQADHDKQYFLAVKDAVRRTVLKFLIPRPHSPAEVLSIANRVSEADKPPLLKHHAAPAKGQDAGELCCRILQQPSLLKIWEESEDVSVEEVPAAAHKLILPPAAAALPIAAAAHPESPLTAQEVVQPAAAEQEEPVEEGGVLDMSMELIPPTPAKTPQKQPAPKPPTPQEEVIELGDSEDEEVVDYDASEEEQQHQYPEIQLKESHDEEEDDHEEGEYNSYEDDAEEEDDAPVNNYPPHFHEYPGNYSESDDYDDEDAEEENRRVAFEGPYDAEEGRGTRGNSSSGGSVEVFDLMSSSDEEQEEAPDESIPHAEVVANDSSADEVPTETEIMNEVVDDYIGAVSSQPTDVKLPEVDDGKILHDNVKEYIAVSSPSKKSPEKATKSSKAESAAGTAAAAAGVATSDEADTKIAIKATEDKPQIVGEGDRSNASIRADAADAKQASQPNEKPDADLTDIRAENALEPFNDEIQDAQETKKEGANPLATPHDEEADKSEPYSSDGGNLGEEFSEDMADDEHESLDTEDDKRSLAEQGETFDEGEAGPSSPVHSGANDESDAMMEIDQPSILVAAAMSSQCSSYPMAMTKNYRTSLKSVDNTAAGDNEIDDTEMAPESPAVLPDHDSDDVQGGALTDDGYVPDVELTEEEKIEKKKIRTIEDGYVPDAEATEEESSKPIGAGNKAVKRRDVRFEAVLETREAPPIPPPPIEPAANQSTEIDDGYIPEGALTEEEKRERQERRSRSVEEGYLPDATDDDTVEKKARRSSHRKGILNKADAIDPGYLASGVEGTEEDRSEEESQEAVASVLVATALVTQKGKLHASDIANKASLATARIARPKFSTQSIDDGYVPDGTFDDEERSKKLRKETRSQYVEEGYLPDGHTTPGEATEDDQPDDKPKLLLDAKIKLSESIVGKNLTDPQLPPPPEPAASLSIDDGYVPSGVEEERSEEEDALTAKATHDTEEESIAIASSADVTEKHSKSDNETAAANESKDAEDVADHVTETKSEIYEQMSQSLSATRDPADAEPEAETEDPSFLPTTSNPLLTAQTDSFKADFPSPKKAVTSAAAKQESPAKSKRSSRREATPKQEMPTQPNHESNEDNGSVQSEASSVRRSSRIKVKGATPSPKVPPSIIGGRASKKAAPSLPVVPENEKLNKPIETLQEAAANEDASTINDGVVTVASKTRRGKRGANADYLSHASVDGESKASKSKRAKTGNTKKAAGAKQKSADDKDYRGEETKDDAPEIAPSPPTKARKGRPKKKDNAAHDGEETKDDAPEVAPSPSTKARRGRPKKKENAAHDGEETKDDAPEIAPSPPTKARRGRSKKDDSVGDVQEAESVSRPQTKASRGRAKKTMDDVSESIASQPSEPRSVRLKKIALKDNVSELTASPPTKTRRGGAKKNQADAATQDDVSESVSSPPKTRRGRAKKNEDDGKAQKDDVSESVASRRTRRTVPSEGSLASTRPRRNTRAPKR